MGVRTEVQRAMTEKERSPEGLYVSLLVERKVEEHREIQMSGSPSLAEPRNLAGEETHMRINLRSYGSMRELHVNGILALVSEEMEVREALEAISDLRGDVDFLAADLRPEGAMQLFDDRFLARDAGEPTNREQRTA